ncbi:MAG: 6-phosphogluconolactonase [Polyangiaceae bacterium]
MRILVAPDVEALAARAAELVAARIAEGSCRLALAGGNTPRPVYRRLAERPELPWSGVEIFFGDERLVPPDDPASNEGMARATLLDALPAPGPRVHRIETERGAEGAATHYATLLSKPLDLVLLGMGGDGHTASLFPGGPLDGAAVIATESPVPPHRRVSLSLSTLNAADQVVLLVAGEDKATRLAEAFAQRVRPMTERRLPVALLAPRGELWWLLDAAAASALPSSVMEET